MAGQQARPKSRQTRLKSTTDEDFRNLNNSKKQQANRPAIYQSRGESAHNVLYNSNIAIATASSSASPRINATQIDEPVNHTTTSTNDQTNPTQNNDIPIPTPASSKKPVSPSILRDKHEYSEVIRILTC
ncbi:hypothetical protein GWI33_014741 [Rhynchophorus ferrugineus]|uniref:Uncharacterized protein n=1 Tax=Rhynchophorus ferrugineus TaxID=354439 RepID=A0A834I4J9_RHYFE|nr:hypothetical protein GWI33_014741 [Rhynchophorus ferrugineus]